MNEIDARSTLSHLTDGMQIRVKTKSGRVVEGVFDGTASSYEDGLYFETYEGAALRADWENVEDVGFRSQRMTVGDKFVVPPEHPLSGAPRRAGAYTKRNGGS